MQLLHDIRALPKEKKIRLIWVIAGAVILFLIIAWAVSAHYARRTEKDTTLFETVEQGVKDLKENYNKPIN